MVRALLVVGVAGVLSAGVLLAGCGSGSSGRGGAQEVRAERIGPVTIELDGDASDWPGSAPVVADEEYLYLRATVDGPQRAIQNSPESLVLLIDVDSNSATGVQPAEPAAARGLGVDLEVHYSPREELEAGSGGVALFVNTESGRRRVSHATFDMVTAPSYAAGWYELRLARIPNGLSLGLGAFPMLGMASVGEVRGLFALYGEDGSLEGWSDPFGLELGWPARRVKPDGEAPAAKAAGSVRVMSWNVERGKPMTEPKAFADTFNALQPDVVLVQEWEGADAEALEAWFRALVPSNTGWHARASEAWGVAVISRYPVEDLGPANIDDPDSDNPLRFVGAVVRTPGGPVAVGSAHLKCCGGAEGEEEDRRVRQATIVNDLLRSELENSEAVVRVLAGDMNLVGSRLPLDTLRRGLDVDGNDLIPAAAEVTGDTARYTWYQPDSRFGPGRLDWVVVGGAAADVTAAFSLDTRRLSDGALEAMNLYRDDSGASDHLPVVVDVRPKR